MAIGKADMEVKVHKNGAGKTSRYLPHDSITGFGFWWISCTCRTQPSPNDADIGRNPASSSIQIARWPLGSGGLEMALHRLWMYDCASGFRNVLFLPGHTA
jgi:hypothetical protein